jgi:hypothetical protein
MNSISTERTPLRRQLRARLLWSALGVLTLVLVGVTGFTLGVIVSGEAQTGPSGFYFRGTDWQGPVAAFEDHAPLTTDALTARAAALGGGPFSAVWSGVLEIDQAGQYRFAVSSDDGAWLFIDDVLVVDNGGAHALLRAVGSTDLTTGSHRVTMRYTQHGGDLALRVLMTRPDGQEQPLAAALNPGTRSPLARWVDSTFPTLPVSWTLCLAAWPIAWLIVRFAARVRREATPAQTALVLGLVMAVAALAAFGIDWGLPARRGWAPDEIIPTDVLKAIDQRFSRNWHYLYPPAQFYLLGLLYAPFAIASRFDLLDLAAPIPYTTLFLIARSASALMASITAAALYLAIRELGHSVRVAVMAIVVAASTPVFVYYGRVANVDMPYVMWYALALWGYAAVIRAEQRPRWYALLGITAGLSLGTKDQAYAFFVLMAGHLAWLAWRRAEGTARSRLAAAARHRGLAAGLVAFTLTFIAVHNIVWNAAGFRAHLGVITGAASQDYRMYDTASWSGQAALFGTALRQVPWCLGWPAVAATVAGAILVVRRRDCRTAAFVGLPILSWYVCLIAVIGYQYDRFFLGPILGLAVLAGVALDALAARARPVGAIAAGAVLAFGVVYGASVPLLMRFDSRYQVEEYLKQRLGRGAKVAFTGRREYLPRLDAFDPIDLVPAAEDLVWVRPDALVVNWPYALRSGSDPGTRQFYEQLESGALPYRLALRARGTAWTLLGLSPRLRPEEDSPFTNLNKINPEIRVYEPNTNRRTARSDGVRFFNPL